MKKFLKWFFIITLVLSIVMGIVVYYFLSTFDLNKYKSAISNVVREQIGRELVIKGDASLGISLVPTIVIEGIELSNADWAKNPNMVELDKIELKFSILPLLKKQIVIDKIALVSPRVYLEVTKEGKANWDFSKPGEEKTAEDVANDLQQAHNQAKEVQNMSADAIKANPQYALLAGFAANSVTIQDGYLQYDDFNAGKVTTVDIKNLDLSAKGAHDPLTASFDVVYDSQSITGNMSLGSLNALVNESIYPVDIAVKAFGVSLNVKGNLKNVLKELSFILDLNAYNPSGNMNAPEAKLDSHIEGDLKAVNVNLNSLEVASNVITGLVKADISGELPLVDATLRSDLIDVTKLATAPKTAFILPELISSAQATTLVPNDPFPYDLLKIANAKVDLDVKRLIIAEGMEADNVVIKADLNNGVLGVSPLTLNFGGGDIQGTANVNANTQQASVKLVSKNMLIQNLYKDLQPTGANKLAIKEGGNVDIDINLATTGNTYRQLVQNLNGKSIIILNKSVVQTAHLDAKKRPFMSQIVNVLKLDKYMNKDLNLNCAVVRTDFSKGKATFPKGIAVDASQIGLVSDGSVDLMNDKIDFGLQPLSGKIDASTVATALTSFARVRGTITDPKITLDEKQAVTTAAGYILGGPVAVGGAAVLGSNISPCYTALEGTEYATRFPAPTGVTATAQDVVNDTKAAVKSTVKDIGNTAKDSLRDIKSGSKEELENLKGTAKDLLKGFKL